MNTIQKLRSEVKELEDKLAAKKSELSLTINRCQHQWGPVQDAHIHTPGYTIEGDPPGTMGVDWRGPTYVPARTDKRWKRVCLICGYEQFTTRTTAKTTEIPTF